MSSMTDALVLSSIGATDVSVPQAASVTTLANIRVIFPRRIVILHWMYEPLMADSVSDAEDDIATSSIEATAAGTGAL
ncbi:MAG: hypothetical protein Q8K82_11120 [Gemmatimonadaceae bacterium]|nr:hypothetical protein [Gemmatimonadaceae bacterium]